MTEWVWIAAAALSFGALVQEVRVYKMRRNHRNQEEIFQVVTENAADMIALVDVKGHRLYNSPSYKRILGYSPAELSETSSFEQIHPEDRMRVLEAARDARESGIGKRLEYRIKHKDGSWRVLESVATTIRNEKGEVAKLVIVNRDITERKRAEAQLEYNLFHDPLTGLPNRRMFLDRLQTAFSRARRDAGSYYALLLVNIDHFKVFNDTMGTQAGDQVLIDIGRRISGALRQELSLVQREPSSSSGDVMLFRLGGDEFAILLESVADPSDAMRTAKTLLMAVAEPLHIDSREVRASISIGIALNTQACMQLREWEMSARTEPMNITVNLSARQLADARLANDVQEALQQTGIDPSRLQLEMTEEVAAADSKLTVTVLSHLKHLGKSRPFSTTLGPAQCHCWNWRASPSMHLRLTALWCERCRLTRAQPTSSS
jgi:diguanylate cyclase (GGDEF)-like protein/PAS domain S-box-containing protein